MAHGDLASLATLMTALTLETRTLSHPSGSPGSSRDLAGGPLGGPQMLHMFMIDIEQIYSTSIVTETSEHLHVTFALWSLPVTIDTRDITHSPSVGRISVERKKT